MAFLFLAHANNHLAEFVEVVGTILDPLTGFLNARGDRFQTLDMPGRRRPRDKPFETLQQNFHGITRPRRSCATRLRFSADDAIRSSARAVAVIALV